MKTSEIDQLQELEQTRWHLSRQIRFIDRRSPDIPLSLDRNILPSDVAEAVAPTIRDMLKTALEAAEAKIVALGVEIDTNPNELD